MADLERTVLTKNPSRKVCEDIIKRILMTEVLEKGTNEHFKTAADFMPYFQSLYPASEALNKQVQRAVKALGMPKDKKGFYIINKTEAQLAQDNELAFLLKKTEASISTIDNLDTVFLQCSGSSKDYLYQMLSESTTFAEKVVTMVNSSSGIILYTNNKQQLIILINSLIER